MKNEVLDCVRTIKEKEVKVEELERQIRNLKNEQCANEDKFWLKLEMSEQAAQNDTQKQVLEEWEKLTDVISELRA